MSRLLAVDDSASMRQMIKLTLSFAGHDVAEACDGEAALELARREKFRLFVIDLNMPRMDGFTLVRCLRAMPEYRFTPLLMLTTESAPEKKALGSAAGATGWLVKPFNPEQLLASIQRMLS